jgi:hypothetical protein
LAYGLSGAFQKASQDELEALITSLAGHFFWAGKFSRLGHGTGALTAPDPRAVHLWWRERRALGLSGPPGPGKAAVLEGLARDRDFALFTGDGRRILGNWSPDGTLQILRAAPERLKKSARERPERQKLLAIDLAAGPVEAAMWRERLGPGFKSCEIREAATPTHGLPVPSGLGGGLGGGAATGGREPEYEVFPVNEGTDLVVMYQENRLESILDALLAI